MKSINDLFLEVARKRGEEPAHLAGEFSLGFNPMRGGRALELDDDFIRTRIKELKAVPGGAEEFSDDDLEREIWKEEEANARNCLEAECLEGQGGDI